MAKAIVYGVLLDRNALDWPGRNQLMTALSRHVPVVLLGRSTARGVASLRRRPTITRLESDLYFVDDALALRSTRLGRRCLWLSASIDGRWLRRALRDHGWNETLLWLTVNDRSLAWGVDSGNLVYDCMDPNFLPELQSEFDRDEFALARRARVVFASARTLHERMRGVNERTHLLPNAAPIPGPPVDELAALPDALAEATGPIVGYLGTVDWRFDPAPVEAAARQLPHALFAIVGRVNQDQEQRLTGLRALSNVVFCGQVSTAAGNACIDAFDVGIIPFLPGPISDAINPVKMWMYLAAGMPVVTTSIAECRDVTGVTAARDDDHFAAAVAAALSDRSDAAADARRAFASHNTWSDRAQTALQILRDEALL